MMQVRKAEKKELERIMEIYAYAQEYMIQNGNPTQWGHCYPERTMVEEDLASGVCHVVYDDGGIHGVFALFEGKDPTYAYIENGTWLNDEPYITIHRIAGDGQVGGVFQCASDYCKTVSDNVRIDTHADNKTMQHLVEKNAFIKCGIIYVSDGTPRLAYHWKRK